MSSLNELNNGIEDFVTRHIGLLTVEIELLTVEREAIEVLELDDTAIGDAGQVLGQLLIPAVDRALGTGRILQSFRLDVTFPQLQQDIRSTILLLPGADAVQTIRNVLPQSECHDNFHLSKYNRHLICSQILKAFSCDKPRINVERDINPFSLGFLSLFVFQLLFFLLLNAEEETECDYHRLYNS